MLVGLPNLTNPLTQRRVLRLICGCAIVLLLAANAEQATATTVPATFAQFHQAPTNINTNVFAYVDNGPSGDAELVSDPSGVVGGALPVIFSYLSVGGPLPADLSGNQNAMLALTSSTLSPVLTAFAGAVGDQQILGNGAFVDTLSITRNTPAAEGNGSRTNLLTMVFTGQLLGAIGGAPQLSGDTTLAYTVTFNSDFLTFSGTSRQFSLTFSSWTSGLQLSTREGDHYFQSATANGTGTFAANTTPVPEPSALILAMIGLFILLCGYGRKRRGQPAIT